MLQRLSFVKLFIQLTFVCCIISVFAGASKVKSAELSATLEDGEQLSLVGTGVFQEFRNDIYVAALFGPAAVTDVDQLIDDNVAKRMSLRFVSEYSNRKLARHWKERMALNNPRSVWQPMTREIVLFSKLFKRNFISGDEINIDHIPGKGTQVYLNGTLFSTFNKPEFASVLLNVWLGNIPPTKAFKSSIRGDVADNVLEQQTAMYTVLTPVKGRFDADLAPKSSPKPKVQQVAKVASKTPPKSTPKSTPIPSAKRQPAASQQSTNQQKAVAEKAKTQPPAQTAQASKTQPKQNQQSQPDANAIKAVKEAPKQVAKITPPVVKEPEIEEDFVDVDLIAGSYTRDLINVIRQYIEYPPKAYRKKEEGDVVAKVVIGRDGSIVDIELLERSGSRALDKAVSKIIRKAAPFQTIPAELPDDQFEFEVPISFTLN